MCIIGNLKTFLYQRFKIFQWETETGDLAMGLKSLSKREVCDG